jgi:hypothetical protein
MSVKIRPAFLAIVFLASPLSLTTNAANAAESCLTAPGKPGPEGSRWYYRLEFPSKRKCWHLVLKGGKPAPVARVTKPVTDDQAEAATTAAPTPAAPAAAPAPVASAPEAVKPAPEPVIRTLVTRNASNPGAVVPSPDQAPQTAAADDNANAAAPAEEAAATQAAPATMVTAAPAPAAAIPAQTSEPSRISVVTLLPAAVAFLGLLACATFFLVEMRRRRTDVLNRTTDHEPQLAGDEPLLMDVPVEEPREAPAERATFAPLPAMRPAPIEDDIAETLRRYARRRAA